MQMFYYKIKDSIGLHARPAGQLAKLAKNYSSKIVVENGERSVDVTKIMAVMSMGIKTGDVVCFKIEGEDEIEAAAVVEDFMRKNL